MRPLAHLLFVTFCGCVSALTDAEIALFVARTHIETNTGVQGTVSVTISSTDSTVIDLSSNGVPDHATGTFPGNGNPNPLSVQTYNYRIPKNPTQASTTTCLPQGPIGLALNGVPMFNPYSIQCCDTGVEELDLFDSCMGHPAPQPAGAYHYHINPQCLFNVICNQTSTIVGVAFDGFPIYGPNDDDGTQLTISDLDECNGKVTNGQYRYHITADFPYFMGCFKGSLLSDSGIQSGNCECTEVANPCTEFNEVSISRKKRQATSTSRVSTFVCCQDASNCNSNEVSTSTSSTTTSAASTSFTSVGIQIVGILYFLFFTL
ncbi:uncharacterized protein LOC120331687 [Styela clava]